MIYYDFFGRNIFKETTRPAPDSVSPLSVEAQIMVDGQASTASIWCNDDQAQCVFCWWMMTVR